jgi:molybdopterin-containing oxidoreductase family iron-sulfur binding subunit
MENRQFKDGDVESACQQACPTEAIVFGNVNDTTSHISQMRVQNPQRTFYVIEQIHTLPNINYLAKIRNTEEIIIKEENGAEHAGQTEKTGTPGKVKPSETH